VDRSNHQGGYGEAFIRVLIAAAGLRLAKPEPDLDGIDFCLWPDRIGALRGARSTPISVQVKSYAVPDEPTAHWRYRLEVPHFNALADPETVFPTYLFLVVVPPDPDDYTAAHPDGLLLSRGAYWHSLQNEKLLTGPSKGAKKTVSVPKANLLTVDSLRTLVSAPHAQVEAS
jgi:hypothetical protein